MNRGTIIRTILAIATVINSGAIATGIAEFANPTVDMIYKIASFAATAVILFVNTYYNNDYSVEGAIGTEMTRTLKEDKDGWYRSYDEFLAAKEKAEAEDEK